MNHKLAMLLPLALLLVACDDAARQVNPGAHLPVYMITPQEMRYEVRQRLPHIADPHTIAGMHRPCSIVLRSDLRPNQRMATMLHEAVHRMADIDPKSLPAAIETLRQLNGEGFHTAWDYHAPDEW